MVETSFSQQDVRALQAQQKLSRIFDKQTDPWCTHGVPYSHGGHDDDNNYNRRNNDRAVVVLVVMVMMMTITTIEETVTVLVSCWW